jgi:hypothetical protein
MEFADVGDYLPNKILDVRRKNWYLLFNNRGRRLLKMKKN